MRSMVGELQSPATAAPGPRPEGRCGTRRAARRRRNSRQQRCCGTMAVEGPGAETRPPARARGGRGEEATMVRLPDAAGQLKNAPVKVLRGFFSGIGQLLLAAERF